MVVRIREHLRTVGKRGDQHITEYVLRFRLTRVCVTLPGLRSPRREYPAHGTFQGHHIYPYCIRMLDDLDIVLDCLHRRTYMAVSVLERGMMALDLEDM